MKSDDEYNKFYESILKIAAFNNIEKETYLGQRRGRRASIEVSQENSYRNIYDEVIDTFVSEMDARFKEDNIRPFMTIHSILTAKDVIENYEKDLSIYKDDIDFNKLDNELYCWTVYKANNPLLLTSRMSELTSMFDALILKEHFPEIFKLFKIYLSAAINTATGERSFSTLKLLKTYLRNSMIQQRLSDLAVISINSDIVNKINIDDIIDKFASVKNRRINLMN